MEAQDKVEILKIRVGVWEKVIDVQMHFNDLCLKIRSFAVSILGVLLGSAAIAYRFAGHVEVLSMRMPTAIIFILISMVAWFAFYVMDRYWYHELLKGAVHHARKIEAELVLEIPDIELSRSIREQSHKSLRVDASTKLHFFYWAIFLVQVVALYFLSTDMVKISGAN